MIAPSLLPTHTHASKHAHTDAYVCVYILFLEKILESDSDSKYMQRLSVISSL